MTTYDDTKGDVNSDAKSDAKSDAVNDDVKKVAAKSKYRVTIEPYLFISIFGMMLTYLTMQNLMLDKACRVNLNYPGKYIANRVTRCWN